jgi:hypothetical protein
VPARQHHPMRHRLLALVGCSLIACVPAAVNACGTNPHATFDNFISAFNALDWDNFRSCLADSASLFNPDIPGAISLHRLDGRSEVERSFRAVFDAAESDPPPRGPNIHPENVSFQIFSNAALVTFEFRRSDGSFGRRSLVLVKERKYWKITHIHASNVRTQP